MFINSFLSSESDWEAVRFTVQEFSPSTADQIKKLGKEKPPYWLCFVLKRGISNVNNYINKITKQKEEKKAPKPMTACTSSEEEDED